MRLKIRINSVKYLTNFEKILNGKNYTLKDKRKTINVKDKNDILRIDYNSEIELFLNDVSLDDFAEIQDKMIRAGIQIIQSDYMP